MLFSCLYTVRRNGLNFEPICTFNTMPSRGKLTLIDYLRNMDRNNETRPNTPKYVMII